MNHGEGRPPQGPDEWAAWPPGPPPEQASGQVEPPFEESAPAPLQWAEPAFPAALYPPGQGPYQSGPQPYPSYPGYPAYHQPYPQIPGPRQPVSGPGQPGYPVPYPGAADPYPGTLPPYAQMPRRRRRWPLWVALGVVAVLLLCVAPAALVISRLPLRPGDASAGIAGGTGAPSPGPNAPLRERVPWVRDQIKTVLDAQTTALLVGDRKGFLAAADPKARKLAGELDRRFGSLRELQVTQYAQRIVSGPTRTDGPGGRTDWKIRVQLQYCFVIKACEPDPVLLDSEWAETSAGLRMESLGQTASDENGPRPWEISQLQAAVGARAVVATTDKYAARLPSLLKQAEAAAANADKFVFGDKRPDRYRIFAAGPTEWKKWYGGDLPEWSVGFATAISDDRMEIVLNLNNIDPDFVDEVMRHEMGHVATLSSDEYTHEGNFWLIEGIAEYIQEYGRPVGRYDGRLAVRRYLREDKWDGAVNVTEPTASTPDWQVGAKYGISYYAMRRLGERFGQAKLLEFFRAVVREGVVLDTAARRMSGVSWASLNADCARYVRRQAG